MSAQRKLVLIILDGVGIGELPDAHRYADEGSNTLSNTAEAVGGLHLPNLQSLGLGNIASIKGVKPSARPLASFGKMAEVSKGKDSTTGHWELAGLILEREFPTFPNGFPDSLLKQFCKRTGSKGYLGNKTASGTAIIEELGNEHVRTGFPIVYTSADSVFQIAAHEEVIPLPQLYEMCERTRNEVCVGDFSVGRVIARPFVGTEGHFTRTTNRRDFSLPPAGITILDLLTHEGIETVSIGKVDDLFAGRGLAKKIHTKSNDEGIAAIISESSRIQQGFIFTNLVDFDTLYGHRNDPLGMAKALEAFDKELPRILGTLGNDDLLVLTADHGNDPVTPSTDHSREYVPVLCFAKSKQPGSNIGTRSTFADIGQTVADFFDVRNNLAGTSFLGEVM
ncbi:MAG: phosphopentomutase [Bacteroidetes bacterium]|nr:phosphopentomutase [Bacteroidota bacterium]MCW5895242.1 phosphopentomutase [Bacteroidota bacterium]